MSARVLVADDQAPFRDAARSVLGAARGFRLVGEATSGEAAIALVELLRPDIVLMDITMAGIGGIQAARWIAAARPETVVVLLSTYREEELPRAAATCGAAAYLHKSEFGSGRLRELWDAPPPSRSRRGRGSPPSPACGRRSPRRDRA